MNINTKSYWDTRFRCGDWESRGGRRQTRFFARALARHADIPRDYSGVLLDFGCGLGDAIPVYHRWFPGAKLIGMDVSEEAIAKCRERYGQLAEFYAGDNEKVPKVGIIVASNVFEHFSGDEIIARQLLTRCRDLFILVPYRETLAAGTEHVNSYDESSFESFDVKQRRVFGCPDGGWARWVDIHLKNVLRPLFRRPRAHRMEQILFHLVNSAAR